MFKQLLSSTVFERYEEQHHQEAALTWAYWFCTGASCIPTLWLVQHTDNDTWRIQEDARGPAWKVLSDRPVCPRCGSQLQSVTR